MKKKVRRSDKRVMNPNIEKMVDDVIEKVIKLIPNAPESKGVMKKFSPLMKSNFNTFLIAKRSPGSHIVILNLKQAVFEAWALKTIRNLVTAEEVRAGIERGKEAKCLLEKKLTDREFHSDYFQYRWQKGREDYARERIQSAQRRIRRSIMLVECIGEIGQ